jgi:hypothetical protein
MFFIFYALKKNLYELVFNINSFIITIPADLSAGLISVIFKFPVKGLIGHIFEILEQDNLLKNSGGSGESSGTGGPSGSGGGSGEGSGEGPSGSGEPSGSGGPSEERDINYADYDFETDSSPEPLPSDDPFGGSKTMAIIYGNEKHIESSTKEELEEAINTIEEMKEMHRQQQAPASDSEIKRLTKKEDLCIEELEKKNSEGEKESSIKDTEDKGKGKEK